MELMISDFLEQTNEYMVHGYREIALNNLDAAVDESYKQLTHNHSTSNWLCD